jgi:hypothetical protein
MFSIGEGGISFLQINGIGIFDFMKKLKIDMKFCVDIVEFKE